jgi:hypothetical protein
MSPSPKTYKPCCPLCDTVMDASVRATYIIPAPVYEQVGDMMTPTEAWGTGLTETLASTKPNGVAHLAYWVCAAMDCPGRNARTGDPMMTDKPRWKEQDDG